MKKFLSLVSFSLLFSIAVFAHGDNSHFAQQQEVTVKTTKVAGNVYMLQGRGGNIGASVGEQGILIVDDDYKAVSEKLAVALNDLGAARPRIVVNTHWHGDHSEGNFFFGKDSIIVAHDNARKRLAVDTTIFGNVAKAYPEYALPIITYAQSMSIHFNGEEIRVVHYPNGHTDGDSVIFFTKSKVVHLGDDFFVGRFPFVDLDNGGSVQGLADNIAALIKQIPADAKIIPGHGPVCTIVDLQNYHQMLVETSDIVRQAIKKKKTLDEVKKITMPAKFEEYGKGFIKTDVWLETLYKSYQKKK
jgi:glyoxylase-like metal-dependent hydrolase (beta-lactamase superfamily II)